MAYILSSLTNDQLYTQWIKNGNVLSVGKQILIYGGANVSNRKTLITPNGVSTEVSDEDLAILKTIPCFIDHLEKGYLKIMNVSKYKAQDEAEKMDNKDKSAQVTPEDYEKQGKKKPAKKK